MTPEQLKEAGRKALDKWVIGFTPYDIPLSPTQRHHLEKALRQHDTSAYRLFYAMGVQENPVAWLAVEPNQIGGKINFKVVSVKL